MFKSLVNRIPEKYRILVFLVATSCIGVSLILVAVYNASSELEVIHEIENMHRFATAQLEEGGSRVDDYQGLLSLADPDYRVIVTRDGKIMADSHEKKGAGWRFQLSDLDQTRVNDRGGYIESDGQIITWTMLPAAGDGTQLLILHQFSSAGVETLFHVYTKRLLVPALFYIWLMVWMGYIVRFLTHKLSEQKRAMEHMALHDTLTGLPNRNLLDDRMGKMLHEPRRKNSHFTVVMMDLDGFKVVNDTHGHAVGDMLLKEVAQRLKACLRPNDTVCRLGGDEFILLLDDTPSDSSLDICKRISTEISKPVVIGEYQVVVGSSMGIAKYGEHSESAEDLIRKSDEAMYKAKSDGGGIVVYDDFLAQKNVKESSYAEDDKKVRSIVF